MIRLEEIRSYAMEEMRHLTASLTFLALFGLNPVTPVRAQGRVETRNGVVVEVALREGTGREVKAREKLMRVLFEYDVEPWIFTREIRIQSGGTPHSKPVLTLTTESEYFENDLLQLASFLHEQIHWFGDAHEVARREAMEELRQLYPDAPEGNAPYLHLITHWLELDAMTQLVGEERAGQILSIHDHYPWIYNRVLQDTEEISTVLARYGLIITPKGGLMARREGGAEDYFQPVATCGNVIHILSENLTRRAASAYCRYAASQRNKVEAFWGATWQQPIRIRVDSAYSVSHALELPYYGRERGFIMMPLRAAREHTGALLWAITNVYAPNKRRFLADGLGVFLQVRLGKNLAVYPTLGQELLTLARHALSEVGTLRPLNVITTPKSLAATGIDNRTAFVVAGSFVRFLIDRYDLETFKRVYRTGDYANVYGMSLHALEEEWRAYVEGK